MRPKFGLGVAQEIITTAMNASPRVARSEGRRWVRGAIVISMWATSCG